MGKQNYFFSGITDILILAILCEHDSYVYEIVKFIKEKSNGCLSISQNTVYAVTYKLVNEGKISEYSKLVGKKRTRIYYHIEDEGRAYYENLLESFHNAYSGVESIFHSSLNIFRLDKCQLRTSRSYSVMHNPPYKPNSLSTISLYCCCSFSSTFFNSSIGSFNNLCSDDLRIFFKITLSWSERSILRLR